MVSSLNTSRQVHSHSVRAMEQDIKMRCLVFRLFAAAEVSSDYGFGHLCCLS